MAKLLQIGNQNGSVTIGNGCKAHSKLGLEKHVGKPAKLRFSAHYNHMPMPSAAGFYAHSLLGGFSSSFIVSRGQLILLPFILL